MIPRITGDSDEPNFPTPRQECEKFIETLSCKERIEFYNTLEVIVETTHKAKIRKEREEREQVFGLWKN